MNCDLSGGQEVRLRVCSSIMLFLKFEREYKIFDRLACSKGKYYFLKLLGYVCSYVFRGHSEGCIFHRDDGKTKMSGGHYF